MTKIIYLIILFIGISSISTQAQLFRPYKCGPVLKKESIIMFDSLNQFLGIEPGTTFAEVGASSGYYNGAMAVHLQDVTFYLQDIDEHCLNEKNLEKVLKYYSRYSDTPLSEANEFHIAIGSESKTNLPDNAIDIIYSNATFHVLKDPDSILSDIYNKLKQDGTVSIRDEFVTDGQNTSCKDKKCGVPLAHYEDFMNTMTRNRFVLVDQTSQFGYPVYKFKKRLQR